MCYVVIALGFTGDSLSELFSWYERGHRYGDSRCCLSGPVATEELAVFALVWWIVGVISAGGGYVPESVSWL